MRKNLTILFILLSFVLPSAALAKNGNEKKSNVSITEDEKKMAEAITAEQLKDYLYFVSSDAMGGRDTPSPGLDITAQFIALNLKRWGFKPAPKGDGTFMQTMYVRKEVVTPEENTLKVGDKEFAYGDSVLRIAGNGMADAPLVFGGNGWMIKDKNIDAFAGVDVKDKIVVIYNPSFSRGTLTPLPDGITGADLKGDAGENWADPFTNAEKNGAKGVIVVAAPQLEQIWGLARRFLGGGGSAIEGLQQSGAGVETDLPVLMVKSDASDAIFADETSDLKSAKAFDLSKSAEMKAGAKVERTPTQNVVAVWEGSDPKLKDEYVAIGAHYDHVGTRENAPGDDKIYNGADDDGSGTVAILAIAEALAKAKKRPKRSILLVWHAGEEKGLLGAAYFNKYPTVDISKVVTQLNIDMIGRSLTPDMEVVKCDTRGKPCNEELAGPNEVYVIGSEMMSSKLGEVTKGTNSAYLNMDYNLKYDDPNDKNQFFFRSDHFHYAKNGIPIVFWFTGTHLDYHQPGDHADKIDYAKMEKIARTIFLTMWEIAELKERPVVDKKLDPRLLNRN